MAWPQLDTEVAAPRVGQLSFLPDPIDQRFVAFHHGNPDVYRKLVGLAREWKAAGHDRCSMNMLFEVLRWDDGVRTKSADGLKLNNDFRSRYARVIAANEPDLREFFETRSLSSERGVGRG
jgi:hypothetical protein